VRRDPVVLIVVAMIVALMLVFGFNEARQRRDGNDSVDASMAGRPAPDFTLQSLDGKTVHLSDFHGKTILLNFWATWCEPCKIEMPWFVELQKQYGAQGLQVVGVAMDDTDPSEIAKYVKQISVDYPILIGKESQRNALADAYGGVQFLPESFYIDGNGKIVQRVFGLKGKNEIEAYVKKALDQSHVAQNEGPK
jgi:thiol-disulfide isomerase/thioredoxin